MSKLVGQAEIQHRVNFSKLISVYSNSQSGPSAEEAVKVKHVIMIYKPTIVKSFAESRKTLSGILGILAGASLF